jgi:hypothetical protein
VVEEVLEQVVVILTIRIMFKVEEEIIVILVGYILMEEEEEDHGIVMVQMVDVVEVKDMPDITFQVRVHRGWD